MIAAILTHLDRGTFRCTQPAQVDGRPVRPSSRRFVCVHALLDDDSCSSPDLTGYLFVFLFVKIINNHLKDASMRQVVDAELRPPAASGHADTIPAQRYRYFFFLFILY